MMSSGSLIPRTRLKGKVAIVTASTDGIGFAIAKRLGAEGASVVISSRREDNVKAAVDKLKEARCNVTGVVCHVGKAEDRRNLIKTAVETYGGIDILVSNAAANPSVGEPVLKCSEEAWDKIFDINLKAAFLITKEVYPHMKTRNGGSIVYISSAAGLQPLRILGAYAVSKTALLGLTKSVALQLAPDNIRVNCLAPGLIETRFAESLHNTELMRKSSLKRIPMGRFGHPDEMASVVAFLCSNDASYITGENLVAAGGFASRL